MARIAANDANFTFVIALEDELNSIGLTVDNNLPEVTAFADTGAEFVEGLHNAKFSLAGACDFANAQGDDTIFNKIGAGETAFDFSPTGAAVDTNNPHYTGNAFVKSYSVNCAVAEAATYTAELQVNGPVVRAEA